VNKHSINKLFFYQESLTKRLKQMMEIYWNVDIDLLIGRVVFKLIYYKIKLVHFDIKIYFHIIKNR